MTVLGATLARCSLLGITHSTAPSPKKPFSSLQPQPLLLDLYNLSSLSYKNSELLDSSQSFGEHWNIVTVVAFSVLAGHSFYSESSFVVLTTHPCLQSNYFYLNGFC